MINVLKNLCEKGIGAAKPKIKNQALECGILMFEVTDCFDKDIFEKLLELCNDKKVAVSNKLIKFEFFIRSEKFLSKTELIWHVLSTRTT